MPTTSAARCFTPQAAIAKWGDMEWEHRNWYSLHLDLRRPDRRAALPQHRFHELGDGHAPGEVVASGGAAWRPREALYGNIYDHMSSDFTYPNGVHLSSHCRQYPNGLLSQRERPDRRHQGPQQRHGHGRQGHQPLRAGTHPTDPQHPRRRALRESGNAHRGEHADRIMARESAYSGLEITWDQIMNSKQDLMPRALRLRPEDRAHAPARPRPLQVRLMWGRPPGLSI